jgi:hypothetical protein
LQVINIKEKKKGGGGGVLEWQFLVSFPSLGPYHLKQVFVLRITIYK